MILDRSLIILVVAAVVCVAAFIAGDWPLRMGAPLIGACIVLGVVSQVDSVSIGPRVVGWADAACAVVLAVLLCATDLRVWIPPALGAQTAMAVLDRVTVITDGRHLPLYFRGANLLHAVLILALIGGTAPRFRRARVAI